MHSQHRVCAVSLSVWLFVFYAPTHLFILGISHFLICSAFLSVFNQISVWLLCLSLPANHTQLPTNDSLSVLDNGSKAKTNLLKPFDRT